MNLYIALDLETTGFDPKLDQVIEIAAIKFEGDKILDRFEMLINPGIEIPPMVSHITGIKNEDLHEASAFEAVKEDLVKFLGNYPIIGHNISFDVSFLQQKGLPLINPLYDTIHLASMLLPGLPSYSLDTITRILKIQHKNKHRAGSDAEASLKLFNLLQEKISTIPSETLIEIQGLIPKSSWQLGEIFNNVEASKPKKTSKKSDLENEKATNQTFETNSKNPEELTHKPLTTEITGKSNSINSEIELLDLFQPYSSLAQSIKDYEERPSQKRMTEKIIEIFNGQNHLLIEAGTGIGKTFAYLLASSFWSLKMDEKVIISTFTNTLQDQIIKKDFPLIEKIFPKLKIAILKGRKKYLSLFRFNKLKAKPFLEEHELVVIIKVLLWLSQNSENDQWNGDLEELNLQNKEFIVLDEICCDQYSCHETETEAQEGCYLLKARRKAENANLIIVNHALLLQNIFSENPILPDSNYIIVDEAHHLEKVTTDALTIHLSGNQFDKVLEKIESQLYLIRNNKETLFDLHQDHDENQKTVSELMLQNHELQRKINQFFGILEVLLKAYGKQNPFQQIQLNLTKYIQEEPNWQKAVELYKNLKETSGAIIEKGFHLSLKLSEKESFKAEMMKLSEALHDLRRKLEDLGEVLHNFDEKISWLSKSLEENLILKSAPLSVSQSLNQSLFKNKKSVVLTSATLTTNHSFKYIRNELGLDESFEELSLPSHFSYPDQVKIIIPENLENPNSDVYSKECSTIISNLIKKNGGRTLVLFTSKKALSTTFHDIASPLKSEGFSVLAQGISGGRGKILSHFKDEPSQSAILGTNSFWEGVDILGNDLTCVVIQKLPFDPPDDPIMYARGQKYNNVFEEYQLPRAILRFKQGFGRLIRSSTDTGSIIILDTRLIQKKYGQQFIQSLPQGIKIEYCSKDKVADFL